MRHSSTKWFSYFSYIVITAVCLFGYMGIADLDGAPNPDNPKEKTDSTAKKKKRKPSKQAKPSKESKEPIASAKPNIRNSHHELPKLQLNNLCIVNNSNKSPISKFSHSSPLHSSRNTPPQASATPSRDTLTYPSPIHPPITTPKKTQTSTNPRNIRAIALAQKQGKENNAINLIDSGSGSFVLSSEEIFANLNSPAADKLLSSRYGPQSSDREFSTAHSNLNTMHDSIKRWNFIVDDTDNRELWMCLNLIKESRQQARHQQIPKPIQLIFNNENTRNEATLDKFMKKLDTKMKKINLLMYAFSKIFSHDNLMKNIVLNWPTIYNDFKESPEDNNLSEEANRELRLFFGYLFTYAVSFPFQSIESNLSNTSTDETVSIQNLTPHLLFHCHYFCERTSGYFSSPNRVNDLNIYDPMEFILRGAFYQIFYILHKNYPKDILIVFNILSKAKEEEVITDEDFRLIQEWHDEMTRSETT